MATHVTTAALSSKQLQAIARALADPRRFEILRHIAGSEIAACSTLRECNDCTPATISHHLKELETAGLVESTKRGKFTDLRFCRETWEAYLATLGQL